MTAGRFSCAISRPSNLSSFYAQIYETSFNIDLRKYFETFCALKFFFENFIVYQLIREVDAVKPDPEVMNRDKIFIGTAVADKIFQHFRHQNLLERQPAQNRKKAGATVRNRTADILITSEVLYQLSYGGP